ncbi:uncharacterized protein LOC122290095 [Carya illinoinensis]|uniref:uncharacterized protein LOC122290095 n=1 Tax=Carya illinoinensis TaxID=32201 RepID=UPI001C719FC2|nr:uncharacterized protein LOC122290095 [Carya illinoinensis]
MEDALSRRDENISSKTEVILLAISIVTTRWWDKIKVEYNKDFDTSNLVTQQRECTLSQKVSSKRGLILYKERVVVPNSGDLRVKLLQQLHRNLEWVHSRYDKTLDRVKRDVFWPSLKLDIRRFIRECEIYHTVKIDQWSLSTPLHPFTPMDPYHHEFCGRSAYVSGLQ